MEALAAGTSPARSNRKPRQTLLYRSRVREGGKGQRLRPVYDLPILEGNAVATHKVLNNIDVHAMADVQESAITYMLLHARSDHVLMDIEIQIEVVGRRLHSPHPSFDVEGGPSALTA